MRNKTSSSMQKTYDECYLICSTAVYFEGQNNEAEALRSWRSALDQIYYHNAYRVPPNYRPKSETEKALQDSLRDMELQCKERVDLLVALERSRTDPKESGEATTAGGSLRDRTPGSSKPETDASPNAPVGWNQGIVPAMNYPDLTRLAPAPPLPLRPSMLQKKGSQSPIERSHSSPLILTGGTTMAYAPPTIPSLPTLPTPSKQVSRTPSPEKRNRMLTTLRAGKDGKKPSKSPRTSGGRGSRPPAASKAAGLAWESISRNSGQKLGESLSAQGGSTTTLDSLHRNSFGKDSVSPRGSAIKSDGEDHGSGVSGSQRPPTPPELMTFRNYVRPNSYHGGQEVFTDQTPNDGLDLQPQTAVDLNSLMPPTPPPHQPTNKDNALAKPRTKSPVRPKAQADFLSYRNEYPPALPSARLTSQYAARVRSKANEGRDSSSPSTRQRSLETEIQTPTPGIPSRRPVANISTPRTGMQNAKDQNKREPSESADEKPTSSREVDRSSRRAVRKNPKSLVQPESPTITAPDEADQIDEKLSEVSVSAMALNERITYIQKHLPKGVDASAAKQIFNEIVVQGDEVHWDDVAGLDVAKKALKEAVVYPFLRPDLFMGLREPARGMLLFGPPGTGKTMLARAVATESKSTFFAISASSLTSKWLGESEKLVRALFSLAKALAPSIIFVDEIDSLLSSRGGSSEHESTRRIKTEFLIQWSDLQRAAAGKAQTDKEKQEGDASRVLVLAATNMPWEIDEAARRRFVRRQYIPLPEGHVRATQLGTLLGHQKHSLNRKDIQVLVELTDGFSGSDITALAKDAAMGPLRSLGEALLYMSMDEIRPIQFEDFEASLINIRPSVSKQGLQQFEDWAKEFGERGG
ncbi:hypothetical protein MMC07_000457 [Pseudocyphellaria aurata]|nr:hypothetical protein [Pseudocyphellaria aurata]